MKILVTGSKGFLGTHTVRHFEAKGHTVHGIDQDIFIDGMPEDHYDVLFHFAAHVGGRKGIDNNLYKVTRNIELDLSLIQI